MNEDVVRMKSELTEQQLGVLNSEMKKYKKSTVLAYVFWFFLGTLGIHKFYIGKIVWGIVYLLLAIEVYGPTIGSIFGIPIGIYFGTTIFTILMSIFALLLLYDAFTIPRQIRKSYEKKEMKVLQKLALQAVTSE